MKMHRAYDWHDLASVSINSLQAAAPFSAVEPDEYTRGRHMCRGDGSWGERSRQRYFTLLVSNDLNNSLTGQDRDGKTGAGDRDEVVSLCSDPGLDAPFTIATAPMQCPFRAARAAAGVYHRLPVLWPQIESWFGKRDLGSIVTRRRNS
jgi:hypothetical protein